MAESAEQLSFSKLLFPGRSVLYVAEVAERLEVTDRHVCALIEEGRLDAIDVGNGSRKFWRVPVEALEKYLRKRHSRSEELVLGNGSKKILE